MDYLNIEVLTEQADRSAATSAERKRGLSVIASTVGKRLVMDRWGVPSIVRSFTWQAWGWQEIAALRAFIARRKGRINPVWLCTDNADLVLAKAAQATDDSIRIKRIAYSQLVFNTGNGRRHIAVQKKDGTRQMFKVVNCNDNLDGTETLVLNARLTEPYEAGKHFSYMTLCRLETDEVRLAFTSPQVCEAQLRFLELPKETP